MRLDTINISLKKIKEKHFWKKSILLFSISLFIFLDSFGQRFTVTSEASEIPLNYSFEVTYAIENGNLQKFSPPRFEGFDVAGPAQSTNISIVNGKISKSVSYTYNLQPKKQGDFVIQPATAIINNTEMKSNSISIKITAPEKKSQQQAQQFNDPFGAFRQQSSRQDEPSEEDIQKYASKNIFVRVVSSKTSLYQGDQVTLSYKLYHLIQFQSLMATKNPSYNGFLSEEFKLPEPNPNERPPVEEYNGKKYYAQEFKRVTLFPTKSGKITIQPIELASEILLPVTDNFFGMVVGYEPYKYNLKSNSIDLDIKPLPEKNKPVTFSGAVGKFSFSAAYDRKKCEVEEPISLKVTYTGTGNLKLITPPKLEFPEEFEAYEPKVKDNYENNGSVVTGSKTFEYIIVPKDGGKFKLPKYEFAYFDVEKGDYIKYVLPETEIEVSGKAKLSENVANFFKRENQEKLKIIYGIKKQYVKQTNFVGSTIFWSLSVSPIIILLVGFFFRKRDYSESELISIRRSKANKIALRRMATAKKLLQQNNEQSFYNEVIRALLEYLSDKLYILQSELSKENIADKLRIKNVADDKIEALKTTLDTCEQSLFSPIGKENAMQTTYTKAIELIIDFEEQLKSNS